MSKSNPNSSFRSYLPSFAFKLTKELESISNDAEASLLKKTVEQEIFEGKIANILEVISQTNNYVRKNIKERPG